MKLVIVLAAFVLVSCSKSNNCKAVANPDCFCTMHYAPVCGCDEVTYSNSCVAECNGISDHTSGECP